MEPWDYKAQSKDIGVSSIDKGLLTKRDQSTASNSTMRISNRAGHYIDLWVNSFKMDLAINGVSAQSRDYREFYPRAMVDIVISVGGQVANDKEYMRLAEFVRQTQISAINGAGSKADLSDPIVRMYLPSVTNRAYTHNYSGWLVHGYIKSIKAGAKRFNTAPSFNFDFVMSYSARGDNASYNRIFTDRMGVRANDIASWMDIVVEQGYGFKSGVTNGGDTDIGDGAGSKSSGQIVKDAIESVTDDVASALDNLFQ